MVPLTSPLGIVKGSPVLLKSSTYKLHEFPEMNTLKNSSKPKLLLNTSKTDMVLAF